MWACVCVLRGGKGEQMLLPATAPASAADAQGYGRVASGAATNSPQPPPPVLHHLHHFHRQVLPPTVEIPARLLHRHAEQLAQEGVPAHILPVPLLQVAGGVDTQSC